MKWIKDGNELISLQEVFRIAASGTGVHFYRREGTVMHTLNCIDSDAATRLLKKIAEFITSKGILFDINVSE